MNSTQKPELLAPAGTLEKLKFAVHYGADAVYIAGKQYGLRAFAGNFDKAEMAEGIQFAHERNVKVYVTVNVFAHNADFEGMETYLKELLELHVDAIIVSDPGIIRLAREKVPELPVHISTQA
ncbi:MAG: U32 family peptidase, partial [Peptococcaceae bacterium]|nr:U32 family peptidase [Peptococcaceae bacterium]